MAASWTSLELFHSHVCHLGCNGRKSGFSSLSSGEPTWSSSSMAVQDSRNKWAIITQSWRPHSMPFAILYWWKWLQASNFKGSEHKEEYPRTWGHDLKPLCPLDFVFARSLLLLTLNMLSFLSFCSSRLLSTQAALSFLSVWAYLFIFHTLLLLYGCKDGVILYLSFRNTCHLAEFAAVTPERSFTRKHYSWCF